MGGNKSFPGQKLKMPFLIFGKAFYYFFLKEK
jgi:hypothetical protein